MEKELLKEWVIYPTQNEHNMKLLKSLEMKIIIDRQVAYISSTHNNMFTLRVLDGKSRWRLYKIF